MMGFSKKYTYSVYGMLHGLGINVFAERELVRNFCAKIIPTFAFRPRRNWALLLESQLAHKTTLYQNQLTRQMSLNYNLKAKILWKIILNW